MTTSDPLAKRQLGRLERVDVRDYWANEATDFTPWLAQPENIVILGQAIGLDLEVEAQEKEVGPFRADILCKETTTGHYVLVENQLEKTDHVHLGQLMTYAAGLDAVTVVWVARQFTDEHRAALDWLNRVTNAAINFFGLEIELWRIGESALAPKFNLISHRNDFADVVKQSASNNGPLSELQQRHLEFWTQFRDHMEKRSSTVRIGKPWPGHWMNVALGRSYFTLVAINGMRDGYSAVHLALTGPEAKAHYHVLHAKYHADIEAKLGSVEWRELPNQQESQIRCVRKMSPADKMTWAELNEWFASTLERWSSFFRPVVKELNELEFEEEPSIGEDESSLG